jgi:hypothetical protein
MKLMRSLVRTLINGLKYEVVELPDCIETQEVTTLVPAPVAHYRNMKTIDEYTCPVCHCPAICSGVYQSLEPGKEHAPRLYDYRCLSGHVYLLRFKYDIWGSYKRIDYDAYVLVQKNKRFSCS